MTVYVTPAFRASALDGSGVLSVAYQCSCGYATERVDVRPGCGGAEAHEAIRGHLVDAHGDELGIGRCQQCGIATNYFRAVVRPPAEGEGGDVAGLAADVWACERHAPSRTVVVEQGEGAA